MRSDDIQIAVTKILISTKIMHYLKCYLLIIILCVFHLICKIERKKKFIPSQAIVFFIAMFDVPNFTTVFKLTNVNVYVFKLFVKLSVNSRP